MIVCSSGGRLRSEVAIGRGDHWDEGRKNAK